jgi:hypothetical protein
MLLKVIGTFGVVLPGKKSIGKLRALQNRAELDFQQFATRASHQYPARFLAEVFPQLLV